MPFFRFLRRKRDHGDPAGRALAEDAEAWLNGELAGRRVATWQLLAPWLLVNRLAHADPEVVRGLARGEEPQSGRPVFAGYPTWATAERRLARQLVVRHGGCCEEIRAYQRDVLVPLELRLIEEGRRAPLTLDQVAAKVSAAITV
ncbi:MAG TPA: hypothetical protein VIL36_07755 [Acidimicrobiales bacterium]